MCTSGDPTHHFRGRTSETPGMSRRRRASRHPRSRARISKSKHVTRIVADRECAHDLTGDSASVPLTEVIRSTRQPSTPLSLPACSVRAERGDDKFVRKDTSSVIAGSLHHLPADCGQPCRLAIASIQIGAKGESRPSTNGAVTDDARPARAVRGRRVSGRSHSASC